MQELEDIFIINKIKTDQEDTLNEYVSKINDEKYNEMYELLDESSKNKISEEDFVTRNKKDISRNRYVKYEN